MADDPDYVIFAGYMLFTLQLTILCYFCCFGVLTCQLTINTLTAIRFMDVSTWYSCNNMYSNLVRYNCTLYMILPYRTSSVVADNPRHLCSCGTASVQIGFYM